MLVDAMSDPEPLTPPDCDLRVFRNLPLDIGRFRASDLVMEESPEAVVAAIMLWGAAWHEVPAASVPDNDRWLANAAGYGRAVDAWLRVREGALRGFVRCSDGRLYNRTLAEKATESWDKRQRHDWSREGDRHRKVQKDLPTDQRTPFPPFDAWKAGERPSISGGTDDLFRRNDGSNPADFSLKERKGKEREGTLGDANASLAFALPDSALRNFRAHRVKLKKPMSDRAEELLAMKLERIWRERGHAPEAVIDQSIEAGWLGVFPLKEDSNGAANRSGNRDNRDGLQRVLDRELGID